MVARLVARHAGAFGHGGLCRSRTHHDACVRAALPLASTVHSRSTASCCFVGCRHARRRRAARAAPLDPSRRIRRVDVDDVGRRHIVRVVDGLEGDVDKGWLHLRQARGGMRADDPLHLGRKELRRVHCDRRDSCVGPSAMHRKRQRMSLWWRTILFGVAEAGGQGVGRGAGAVVEGCPPRRRRCCLFLLRGGPSLHSRPRRRHAWQARLLTTVSQRGCSGCVAQHAPSPLG